MKQNKATYLSIFFLLCFVFSFGVNTIQNLNISISKDILNKNCFRNYSEQKKHTDTNTFVFEENENESEADFNVQHIVLPFFISILSNVTNRYNSDYSSYLPVKQTCNIYLSVCNFRI